MARDNLTTPVAAAATTQVKLCPYDEEKPRIWFHLIKAQFAAVGIRSQKLKYANALTNLPKQVLRDILDSLDVCNESDKPFHCLKTLCSGSSERANGNPILSCYTFPWKCGASSPAFSSGSKNNISPLVFLHTTIFSWPCSLFACRHPCARR